MGLQTKPNSMLSLKQFIVTGNVVIAQLDWLKPKYDINKPEKIEFSNLEPSGIFQESSGVLSCNSDQVVVSFIFFHEFSKNFL